MVTSDLDVSTLSSKPVGIVTLVSNTGVSNLISSNSMGNAEEARDPVERGEKVVDENANRLFIGTDIFGSTLPRNTYERLLTSKFFLNGCLNVMKTLVEYLLKKKKLNLSDIEVEAES